MSQDNSRLFDDLSRVAGGAFSVFSAIAKQVQAGSPFANQSSTTTNNDDIERLQGVISKLRMEQEDLKSRITILEKLVGVKKEPAKKAPAPKKKTVKKS